MSVAVGEELERGLARFLADTWNRSVKVTGLRASSAGARRSNVLFDADDGNRQLSLCATIIPNLNMIAVPNTELRRNFVDAEASVRTVAAAGGVPVPAVYGVCTDTSYVGGPFFVSERVEGETVPRRVLRLVHQHGIGPVVGSQLGTALARLHAIDAADAPTELTSFGKENPAEATLAMTDRLLAGLYQARPALALALRWLERRLPPAPTRRTLVHTDVRNGNVVVGPEGLRAIFDWESCTRDDDPMKDLAWAAVRMWRFGEDHDEIGGFCGIEPYLSAYQAAGGTYDEDRFDWWKVMRSVYWALMLATQAHEYLDGTTPSLVMAASGRRVAELEWDVLMLVRPKMQRAVSRS
jgi:aminoglycoside phosphotransferase (APT) family kinase protein